MTVFFDYFVTNLNIIIGLFIVNSLFLQLETNM